MLLIPGKMITLKQGFLIHEKNKSWSFFPGRTLCAKSLRNNNRKSIPLPDFENKAESLVASRHMAQGWIQFKQFNQNLKKQHPHSFWHDKPPTSIPPIQPHYPTQTPNAQSMPLPNQTL